MWLTAHHRNCIIQYLYV